MHHLSMLVQMSWPACADWKKLCLEEDQRLSLWNNLVVRRFHFLLFLFEQKSIHMWTPKNNLLLLQWIGWKAKSHHQAHW